MRLFLCGMVVLSVASAAENGRTAEGNWVGGAQVTGKYVFLRGRIETKDGKSSAVIDAPLRSHSASTEVLRVGKTVSFGLPIDGNSLQLKGLVEAERITGSVARADGTKVGDAVLRRWTPVDSKILSLYSGDYNVGDSRMITIQGGRFGLYYYDSGTGTYGIAYPSSSTEFFLGPAALHFDRVASRISFITDAAGRVLEVRLRDGHSSPLKGLPTKEFRTADVVVPNGDIRLSATVRVPQTDNRHVGVVLIHGSGPQDRNGFNGGLRIHADELARRGITVLTYDKRGVGSSSGDFDKSTYEELKADALSMVRYLRARSDLGLTRVGVWGISQGGQLAPMVAAAEPSIGFVANTSGTVTNPEEQEIYRTIAQLRAEGLDEATVRDGTTLQILKFYYARTGIGWQGYQEYYQRYHNAVWFEEIIGSPPTKEGTAWAFWRAINVIEPSEFWRQVPVPSLVIFGGRDRLTPVERSIALFRQAMARAGNQRVEVKLFPEATHDMHEDPTGQINQMTDIQRYQPGYFDLLSNWIIGAAAPEANRLGTGESPGSLRQPR